MTDPGRPADPGQSTETNRLRRIDARMAIYGKWVSRIGLGIVGLGLTAYCVRHIVEEGGESHAGAGGTIHIIIVALFGVLGLCIAGGKRTIDGITAITGGIRAWRGSRNDPPPPLGT